ncbi:helix-turn-helix domain-containing protein [Photobacterium halotolerans]|uniref:helix-turn-helix domain-containing protein n=1 Tax=Photobacterium halotolerans TaxID=265726 RepID=UPI0003FDB9B4|nr:helix-turn-helix domain-containing protein [Photobacterium halotolerans]NAW87093.1 helix-turn-helix domain-containing protein [Photobacterium halotolerans]NAX49040.1 helix-turn-helix domain-containing protein [Photobacterium halotolerans]
MKVTSARQLSHLLQDQRKKQGQSQSVVARKVGLRQDTVSKFENAPDGSRLDTLFKLLAALDLELEICPRGEALSTTTQWKEEW